jgi:2-pyrone-4,6-dicarboxylate lactonase
LHDAFRIARQLAAGSQYAGAALDCSKGCLRHACACLWPARHFSLLRSTPVHAPGGAHRALPQHAEDHRTEASRVRLPAHGYDNRVILDAIANLGDSARGIANINSSFDFKSLQALAEGGIRGARFHLMKDRPGSEDHLNEHLPVLQKLGWILVLHVDPPDFIEHEGFIRALPTVTIIDHMARVRDRDGLNQPAFRLLLDLLKDDRFWVKLCSFDKISAVPQANVKGSLPYLDMVPFAQAVIEAAPDRVIWGTDWPHGNTFTPGRTPNEGDLLDLLAVIAPDKALRERILVDNPARLFGFAPD